MSDPLSDFLLTSFRFGSYTKAKALSGIIAQTLFADFGSIQIAREGRPLMARIPRETGSLVFQRVRNSTWNLGPANCQGLVLGLDELDLFALSDHGDNMVFDCE